MKKILPPLIVFAGAFLGTLLLQKNSFVMQEYDGLFLLSGDYFSAMLRTPFPVSGIIGDFLTQFFRFGVYAPLIVAAGVCLAFLLVRSILGRFGLPGDLPAAALSCGLWVAVAFAPTARRGVAVVLILCLLWALSRLLPKRDARWPLPLWLNLAGTALLAAGAFLFIALNGTLQARERMATVRDITSAAGRVVYTLAAAPADPSALVEALSSALPGTAFSWKGEAELACDFAASGADVAAVNAALLPVLIGKAGVVSVAAGQSLEQAYLKHDSV